MCGGDVGAYGSDDDECGCDDRDEGYDCASADVAETPSVAW